MQLISASLLSGDSRV